MTRTALMGVISEARRFIDKAEVLLRSQSADRVSPIDGTTYHTDGFDASKESGAVRRASLDLSRALAALRGRHDS